MTVEVRTSNEHRHVVAFAPGLRELFASLSEDTTLPAEMERLHTRENCWRLAAVGPTGRGDARDDNLERDRRVVDVADHARPSPATR
jgi:hypothetical protein